MPEVDTLGMRVVGSPFGRGPGSFTGGFPPNPPEGGGGKPRRRGKHHGTLTQIPGCIGLYRARSLQGVYSVNDPVMVWYDNSKARNDLSAMSSGASQAYYEYDATIGSGVVTSNGDEGFNVSGDTGTLFLPDAKQFTVHAVFKPVGSDTPYFSMSEFSGDSTQRLGFDAAGHFAFETTFSGTTVTSEAFAVNQWHYVQFVSMGNNVTKVYVDGKKRTWPGLPAMLNSPTHWHIASGWYTVFGGYPRMVGSLAELAFYKRILTTDEILTCIEHAQKAYHLR